MCARAARGAARGCDCVPCDLLILHRSQDYLPCCQVDGADARGAELHAVPHLRPVLDAGVQLHTPLLTESSWPAVEGKGFQQRASLAAHGHAGVKCLKVSLCPDAAV